MQSWPSSVPDSWTGHNERAAYQRVVFNIVHSADIATMEDRVGKSIPGMCHHTPGGEGTVDTHSKLAVCSWATICLTTSMLRSGTCSQTLKASMSWARMSFPGVAARYEKGSRTVCGRARRSCRQQEGHEIMRTRDRAAHSFFLSWPCWTAVDLVEEVIVEGDVACTIRRS